MNYNLWFRNCVEGYLGLEDIVEIIFKTSKDTDLIDSICVNYEQSYYEGYVYVLSRIFSGNRFSFPVVSGEEGFVNYGTIFYTPKPLIKNTNHKSTKVSEKIRELLGDNYLVLFKNPDFEGFSFSGAMYTAYKLEKDTDKVCISFEIDSNKNVLPVSKIDKKEEVCKKYQMPLVSFKSSDSVDNIIGLVKNILNTMDLYNDLKEVEIDTGGRYIVFCNDTHKLKRYTVCICKYLHKKSIPSLFIENNLELPPLNVPKVILLTESLAIGKDNLKDVLVLSTDSIDLAYKLSGEFKLITLGSEGILSSKRFFNAIDNIVRNSIPPSEECSVIDKLVELTPFYGDTGIPCEKLNLNSIPNFLRLENHKLYFKNQVFKSYFNARHFVEKEYTGFNPEEALTQRFILTHPEFELLPDKLKKRLIKEFYNSEHFRNLWEDEYTQIVKLARKLGIDEIYNYEKTKEYYRQSKYDKALKLLQYSKTSRELSIKTNILLDLWALDNLEEMINNLEIPTYKKYGQLISLYIKKLDIQKAMEIAEKKLKNHQDKQRFSYHILVLAYDYRLNPSKEKKNEILNLFENYLRKVELGIYKGEYSVEDKIYLIRNFSYSLIDHPALRDTTNLLNSIDKHPQLYPTIVNYGFVSKDVKILRKILKKNLFYREPVEYLAALTSLFILENTEELRIKLIETHRKLVDRFNRYLKPIKLKTDFPDLGDDISEFFKKLVYIQ